ncbi:MAG: F0F1 ATP synthase subunit B [Verrucomicrobiota bacterium]
MISSLALIAAAAPPEGSGLLGFNFPALIAQFLCFLLVFFILKKLAFGPIVAQLEARRRTIEEAEANAAKMKDQLSLAEDKVKEMMAEANDKAQAMIDEANATAEKFRTQKQESALGEAQQIVEKAREATRLEREQAMADLKKDFSRLLIASTSKVTGKVLTEEDKNRLNQEAVAEI